MRIITIFAAMALACAALPAAAGPFAPVGDAQVRQDVDILKAAGLIRGPVDSWPLPWAQIDQGIEAAKDGQAIDPYVAAAAARLDRLSEMSQQKIRGEAQLSVTNHPAVARAFGETARAKADGSASVEFNTDAISVTAGVGARSGQGGHAYNFEPSQVAIRLDNWAVYAGWTEAWFGPGHDGALIFSNSTRPFPKVGIKRLIPTPINLPVLRWLGPIRLDFFGGVLDETRDFKNTIVFGTRISFAPAKGFEVGLNRAQQLCGRGRPCGFKQITKSFIGLGNADNPKPGDSAAFLQQAGNQLAGYDMSYVRRFGKVSGKAYFEVYGEDEAHILIEQYSRQIGMNWSGPWGTKGASWTATLEYADTFATELFNGTPLEKALSSRKRYPYATYNNSLYTSGFTYNALPIGYWTAGDSRNLSLAMTVTDTLNRRWYGSLRSVHLNITNLGNPPLRVFPLFNGDPGGLFSNPVSKDSEKFALLTGGVELPLAWGDVHVEARYQTDSPNTPGTRSPQAQIEVGFRQRF